MNEYGLFCRFNQMLIITIENTGYVLSNNIYRPIVIQGLTHKAQLKLISITTVPTTVVIKKWVVFVDDVISLSLPVILLTWRNRAVKVSVFTHWSHHFFIHTMAMQIFVLCAILCDFIQIPCLDRFMGQCVKTQDQDQVYITIGRAIFLLKICVSHSFSHSKLS